MSIITARGKAARESASMPNESNVDFKKVFIQLKDGESVRVRLLSDLDYVEYFAHGHYTKGIFTQPCIEGTDEPCAFCKAAKYQGEVDDKGNPIWKALSRRRRYTFAFADIDQGIIRYLDVSKNQAQRLILTIDEYTDDISEIAFSLKRVGDGKDTSYILNPIIRLKPDDQPKFQAFDGQAITDENFVKAIRPRTREQQLEELTKAGFPVNEVVGLNTQE